MNSKFGEMFKRYLAAVVFVAVLVFLGLISGISVANAQQAPSNFSTKTVPFFLARQVNRSAPSSAVSFLTDL